MKKPNPPAAVLAAALAWTACASVEPRPIEPAEVLARLESARFEPATPGEGAAGPRALAAFAVARNPRLAAARAELGVARALLVEAGLLEDPELSWDAMDLIAAEAVTDTHSDIEVLSGFGLTLPLPRPGELDARVGAAEGRAEEARRLVVAAEWALTRDVHVAYEEVRAAEELLAQIRALSGLADATRDYFERAREAGAATAIQANLAVGEAQAIRLQGLRVEARAERARQALNTLLGLPPDADVPLADAGDPSGSAPLAAGPAALTEHAVKTRPDLAALLARYETAEEEVKLALSRQFPGVAVGTGLAVTLPLSSRFARPAIRTAVLRRERVARELTAAVHAAREEVAAAHVRWERARRQARLVHEALLPNAERSLALSREAFDAGEATLLETLSLQRALVEARTLDVEARAERAKQAWELLAASGWMLAPADDANEPTDTPSDDAGEDGEP